MGWKSKNDGVPWTITGSKHVGDEQVGTSCTMGSREGTAESYRTCFKTQG